MTTIVFVHGLGNKPESIELLRLWQRSLSRDDGVDLSAANISSVMVYWADVFYSTPDTDLASYESADDYMLTPAQIETISDSEIHVRNSITLEERIFIEQLAKKYDVPVKYDESTIQNTDNPIGSIAVYERVPLPGFLKEIVMAAFVKEAYAYVFDKESNPTGNKVYKVRAELRNRFISALKQIKSAKPNESIVILSHSMGTMIAYDCLKCIPDCPSVDGFFTIGSPLGIDEIQDGFAPNWTRNDGFPSDKLKKDWINIYDPLDVVARLDPDLADDYQKSNNNVINDIVESNWGAWRHSISKYLQGNTLRSKLKMSLNI